MSLVVALLVDFGVFLFLLCVNIGMLPLMRMVLEECVELRCKRAIFHADHGKISSVVSALLYGALSLGLPMLVGTAAITRVAGDRLLSDPADVAQLGWGVATVIATFLLYMLIEGWRGSIRYRKGFNIRMWIRQVEDSGLAVAHNFFLVGWLRRAAKDLYFFSVCELAVLVAVDVAPDMPPASVPLNGSQMAEFWRAVGIVVVCALFKRVFFGIWSALRPDLELIDICTDVPLYGLPPRWRDFNLKRAVRPGRWRDKAHLTSFRTATLVEICLSTMDRYVAAGDMERVSDAGRRIAESLRLNALHASGNDEALAAFEERKMLALLIVSAAEPLQHVPGIMRVTEGEPEPPALARRKVARVVEAVNGAITAYWSSLRILFLAAGIVLFLVLGRYTEVAGLLGK